MMVMTAKVNLKKIMLMITAAAALVLVLILLMGGGNESTATTAAPAVSGNEGRIQFLKNFGWEVSTTPTESSQVRIPQETSEVFDRYNTLQKGQGYDLSAYAGKNVMRYVYEISNYPGAKEPVYATLLVHKNQVIGGDVTDTAAGGKIRGFKMPESTAPSTTATAGQ
ncbi:MAG: DUF4830 domain-containing protein [Oscillospiraceae bacterium]|nr:DUF4830 domain-containing protein [Oscillospiraceae bacterium]